MRSPCWFRNACKSEGVAENANIGVPVRGNAIKIDFPAGKCFQRFAEGKVVDGILAVEECSVDVKEIRVECVPGAGKSAGGSDQAILRGRS